MLIRRRAGAYLVERNADGAAIQVSHYGADELLREMANAGVDAALIIRRLDPRSHVLAVRGGARARQQFAILGYLPPDSRKAVL